MGNGAAGTVFAFCDCLWSGNGILRGEPVDEISGETRRGSRRFVRGGCVLLYAAGAAAAVEGNEAAVFVGNDVDLGRNPHGLRGIAGSTKCEEIREVKNEERRTVPEEDSGEGLARRTGARGNCMEVAGGKGLNRQRLEE
jgi:hypothetical protein